MSPSHGFIFHRSRIEAKRKVMPDQGDYGSRDLSPPPTRMVSLFSHSHVLTFSYIQQICSRRLWKHLRKNLEKLHKGKYNNQIKLKPLWQKVKLLIMSNFTFCRNVFKSRLQQRRQKVSVCGKRVNASAADDFWNKCGKRMNYSY